MSESARRPSGSANGPAVTTPRYFRPSLRLHTRTSDCDGASWRCSGPRSTGTVRSSLPGRSNIVTPTEPPSSGSAGFGPPAFWMSSVSCCWTVSGPLASGMRLPLEDDSVGSVLALAAVAEADTGAGVGGVRDLLQTPAAVDRVARPIGQSDQRREPAVRQEHAVRDSDPGGGVDVVAVGVEHLRRRQRRGAVHAHQYLSGDLVQEPRHPQL